jgi:hypothetical protein
MCAGRGREGAGEVETRTCDVLLLKIGLVVGVIEVETLVRDCICSGV